MGSNAMLRNSLVLMALMIVGFIVVPRRAVVSRSNIIVVVDTITNSQGMLHLTNSGACAATIYPMYSLATRSEDRSPAWRGLPSIPKRLQPGQACGAAILLPNLGDRPWRVGVWCEDIRPAWKDFLHNWLITFGLRERGKTAFIKYSQWFNTNSTSGTPDGL